MRPHDRSRQYFSTDEQSSECFHSTRPLARRSVVAQEKNQNHGSLTKQEASEEKGNILTRTRHITKPRIQVSRLSTRNWVQIGKLLFMRASTACRRDRESASLLLLLLLLLLLYEDDASCGARLFMPPAVRPPPPPSSPCAPFEDGAVAPALWLRRVGRGTGRRAWDFGGRGPANVRTQRA